MLLCLLRAAPVSLTIVLRLFGVIERSTFNSVSRCAVLLGLLLYHSYTKLRTCTNKY
jgi:hypothetical protein